MVSVTGLSLLLQEYQNGTTHKKRQSCNCTSIDSEGRGYGQDNVYCYQCLSFWKTLILIVKATKVGRAWVCGPETTSDNSGRMSAKILQANKKKNFLFLFGC